MRLARHQDGFCGPYPMEAPMRQRKKTQAGFSLVELLVAITIMAVGLLGLAELQITAMRTNSKSEGMLSSAALAQMVIEDVMSRADSDPMFDAAVTNATWPGSTPGQPAGTYVVAGGGTYNVAYTVNRGTGTGYQGVTGLCLVRVTVTPANAPLLGVFTNRGASMTTLKRST